jgi:MFS family permease
MTRRKLLLDLAPLRRSRDLRMLVGGQLVSVLGTQMAAVAVPYQVYRLTRSSLDVGLVSLAQLLPLIGGALLGGAIADAVDRRRLLLAVELLLAACSAGLALNAGRAPALWPLFALPALAAGLAGLDNAGRSSVIPGLVRRSEVPAANAMFQALFQFGGVAGPAIAGLLLAGTGIKFVYWADAASFGAAFLAVLLIAAQPPAARDRVPGRARRRLPSLTEGFAYLRGRPSLQGAFLIDINATVLGMPRALFPALAATAFGGGAVTVGLLYAAPGAGALIGALTTGWVGRVRRQGRAVIIAVIVWGLAITGFGLAAALPGVLPGAGRPAGAALAAGLVLLAVAGWADVISAVFRTTIVQLQVPAGLLGRLSGLQIAVVTGGPSLGNLEAGLVAAALGDTVSVISGGLACIAGALALARLLPGFRHLELASPVPEPAEPAEPTGAGRTG